MTECKRPDSLTGLLEIINSDYYHIFAGGTDLLIRKRQWQGAERKFDKNIVFINQLPDLKGIYIDKDYIRLLTCTTQDDIASSVMLPEYIKTPYRLMGNPAIRNTATVGGNIANAAQVADSLPIFYALDASLVLKSVNGDRIIKVRDFIKGRYRTDLRQNELIYEVVIPQKNFTGFKYKKIGSRKSSILSKLSVFIVYKKNENELEDIRISIGAVNQVPIRSESAEQKFLSNNNMEEFLYSIREIMKGEDDKRSTKQYREEISLRIVRKYLVEILNE